MNAAKADNVTNAANLVNTINLVNSIYAANAANLAYNLTFIIQEVFESETFALSVR